MHSHISKRLLIRLSVEPCRSVGKAFDRVHEMSICPEVIKRSICLSDYRYVYLSVDLSAKPLGRIIDHSVLVLSITL